jgi:putative nucleotidyltransferase with HDIG domain
VKGSPSSYRAIAPVLFTLAVIAAVLPLFALTKDLWIGAGFILITLGVARIIPLDLPGGSQINLAPAVEIAGALAIGPAVATASFLGRGLARLFQNWGQQRKIDVHEVFFGVTAETLASFVAGWYAWRALAAGPSVATMVTPVACGLLYLTGREALASVLNALRYQVNVFAVFPRRLSRWPGRLALQLAVGLAGYLMYRMIPLTAGTLLGFIVFGLLVTYAAKLYLDMRSIYWSTLLALIPAIEGEFEYGEGHSKRVATYSAAMARKLLLTEDDVFGVYVGALAHDVGMAGIDDRIVNKQGPLSAEEFAEIQRHVETGANIVQKVPFLKHSVDIVKRHHERWDGGGYPGGVKGPGIPLGARIVAIADAFDAMTSKRPYREQMGPEAALQELVKHAGTQFDPGVVAVLRRVVHEELRWGRDVFERYYSLDLSS